MKLRNQHQHKMSPQSSHLSLLFMLLLVSFALCFGSHIEETHHQTNHQHYTGGMLMKPIRHEHFGIMTRAYGSTPSPRSQRTVNVEDYGAKANDGKEDTKV